MSDLLKIVQKLNEQESNPAWVSSSNASLKAFNGINELAEQRRNKIMEGVSKLTRKSDWQISVAEVARKTGVSRVTLGNTASYSIELKAYLESINRKLESLKREVKERKRATKQKGKKANKKSEILRSEQLLRKKVEEMESKQVTELLELTISKLPLPVRKQLGLI